MSFLEDTDYIAISNYESYIDYMKTSNSNYEEIKYVEMEIEDVENELEKYEDVDLESLSDEELDKYDKLIFNLNDLKTQLSRLK